MSEQEYVVNQDRITYEGLFSVAELYRLIDEWLLDKGYYRKEPRHIESVKPDGRFVELELEPTKELTDYAKSILRLRIQLSNLKEVSVETEGSKQKMNQGKVHIVFSGILETDYEGKWEQKPIFLFIRSIYDKFLYKPLTGGHEALIKDDVEQLKNRISGFLNLHRYTA